MFRYFKEKVVLGIYWMKTIVSCNHIVYYTRLNYVLTHSYKAYFHPFLYVVCY